MPQLDTVKVNQILTAIQEEAGGVDLPQLMQRLNALGLSDQAAIKACIWRLIDQHVVELTRERKLRAGNGCTLSL